MKYENRENYIVTKELLLALNAAKSLQKPLLIKCEPETNKDELVEEIASEYNTDFLQWGVSAETEFLLSFSKLKHKLWQTFEQSKTPILWIDGVESTSETFGSSLMKELAQLEFFIHETQQVIKSPSSPIVIITLDCDKELKHSFLRHCFFHYLRFPCKEEITKTLETHYPYIEKPILDKAVEIFFGLRQIIELKKKPCLSELMDWLQLIFADIGAQNTLLNQSSSNIPLLGALLKNEQDLLLVQSSEIELLKVVGR